MINTMYPNFSEALNNFLSSLREEQAKLIAESNQQAQEARALQARVVQTIEKQDALQCLINDVATVLTAESAVFKHSNDNIKDALTEVYNGEVPEIDDVSQFEGFCAGCGKVLSTDTCNEVDGDLYCDECAEETDEEWAETPEDETPEE